MKALSITLTAMCQGKFLQMKNKQDKNFTCIIADVKFSFWQPKRNAYELL